MYNILIAAGTAVAVLLILLFGFNLAWWGALLISLAFFAAVYVVCVRITMKKVMAAMEAASKDLQAQRFEKAIRVLKEALQYGKWQIYVSGQINSQIGTIYYMKREKKDKMISTFEKAVQWSAKESLLWNVYAYCLNESGEPTRAKEVLEKGLKKLPTDTQLKENLESLNQGKKMKMRSYGDLWFQFHLESAG